MQMNVREVERIFGVPEERLYRWIREHALPYREVSGEYFFNRSELLEWATAHQIRFSPELLHPDALEVPALADALAEGRIVERVDGDDRDQAIRHIVGDLPLPDGFDRDGLVDLLLAREALGSTSVGDGIAIPHVRHPMVASTGRPVLGLYHLSRPMDFGALDRQPVQSVFMLISPTVRTHLRMIASIAEALRDDNFRSSVRRKAGREEILAAARALETKVAPTDRIPASSETSR